VEEYSSVVRLAGRFWNGFPHGSRPARRMIFSNVVRKLDAAIHVWQTT
jgi:hypothetical protein